MTTPCGLTVSQITGFTITGTNEEVTCALNTIFNRTVDIFPTAAFQIELCKGKSIAKVYTSSNLDDDPDNDLVDTDTAKAWLNASNVCYTQETLLQVLGSASQVRELLWGNVDIRSLFVCSEFVYLQVDPALLRFTREILTNCSDPSVVRCYKDVPLDCPCEIVVETPKIEQSEINRGSAIFQLVVNLPDVEAGNSIYVAVQSSGQASNPTVVDNQDGSYILAKTASVTSTTRAQVWYLDNVSGGPHNITITFNVAGVIAAEAAEVSGIANPSLDVDNNIGSTTVSNTQQDDFITTADGNLGFMSVLAIFLFGAENIQNGPDGSTVVEGTTIIGGFSVAALQKQLGEAGLQIMQSKTATSVPWAASAVGIRGAAIPCVPTNCRSPVPDCTFTYPCEEVKCCNKQKESHGDNKNKKRDNRK